MGFGPRRGRLFAQRRRDVGRAAGRSGLAGAELRDPVQDAEALEQRVGIGVREQLRDERTPPRGSVEAGRTRPGATARRGHLGVGGGAARGELLGARGRGLSLPTGLVGDRRRVQGATGGLRGSGLGGIQLFFHTRDRGLVDRGGGAHRHGRHPGGGGGGRRHDRRRQQRTREERVTTATDGTHEVTVEHAPVACPPLGGCR
ncbi:hypothetical protein DC432_01890 [Microbacterium testaceum]|uniref:Uncharacterized protein n=1 Tax=Microbacterium testaceum TaxID=2033 RepID=A0A2T7WYD4_MICTE|nr:hypothetical protein DC432_01890 [Microbacterium testaceum]